MNEEKNLIRSYIDDLQKMEEDENISKLEKQLVRLFTTLEKMDDEGITEDNVIDILLEVGLVCIETGKVFIEIAKEEA